MYQVLIRCYNGITKEMTYSNSQISIKAASLELKMSIKQ